jgi:type II secretion system protein G
MTLRLNKKGFTLIELLIVVAIIGIIAAIAIPNLLNAIQRGKQKRTMADMRAVGTACEEFAVDYNRYPQSASEATVLVTYLEPTYIKKLPVRDGWNNMMDYVAEGTNAQSYTITSHGKDGASDGTVYIGQTTNFNNDIVFSMGSFIEWPEGVQQ